ncbi:MAG: hypothetical protein MK066_01880 [Crocinitomicaceae bacterium]|nr:hypothetical protein [Crocinitomicaceae bacterium]
MSKSNIHPLTVLIKSLTKAEKRHFKLYAKRNFGDKDLKFLTLFDLIVTHGEITSSRLEKKLPEMKPSALSNLKAHLYEQLLISLRLIHHNDPSIRIEELISFANVLYVKGLYLQSLEQLKRARIIATNFQNDLALYTIIEMERKIELFFVTDSGYDRAKDIVDTNVEIRNVLQSRDEWSNLALVLYDYYLKFGHVKNEDQFKKVEIYFKDRVSSISVATPSLHSRVYKEMSYTWFHFITQNFVLCYKHANNWVEQMRQSEYLMKKDPIMYLKGIHNILSALFYSNKPRQFEQHYNSLITYIENHRENFDSNTRITADIYNYIGKLNLLFLKGDFSENDILVAEIDEWLNEHILYLDQIRIQVFYYKMACLYFGSDEFKKCIIYLNRIINSSHKEQHLKQDVQCFARILNLVAHYELGNDELVEYQLKNTYRFLIKYGDLQQVQKLIIEFIRKSVYMNRNEMTPHFIELKSQMVCIFDDKYEQRPLLYLDLISWLTAKVEGRKVEHVIQERQRTR